MLLFLGLLENLLGQAASRPFSPSSEVGVGRPCFLELWGLVI